jgi:hypothetical protein
MATRIELIEEDLVPLVDATLAEARRLTDAVEGLHAERFVRSIRTECLDRLILFGGRRLLRALDEFVAHYHGERNHQGPGNELITPAAAGAGGTQVRCRDRLGGLLRCYHRAA